MNSNFKKEELVKVQNKEYPVVGGRLRLAHEENKQLSIITSIVQYDDSKAVIQASVTTDKGTFSGLGMASAQRDARLKLAILELAETRAIARALRFAGYGVEYTGAEEMGTEEEPQSPKAPEPQNGEKKLISKAQAKRLYALSGGNEELCKKVVEKYGYNKSTEIQTKDYEKIADEIEAEAKK